MGRIFKGQSMLRLTVKNFTGLEGIIPAVIMG
jgi:hypothetical protein